MQEVRLIVLGEGGVGKSSFTIYYIAHVWVDAYDPTIEDAYKKEIIIAEQKVTVQILDTAPGNEFYAFRQHYTRILDGGIFIYSIANKFSFDALPQYVDQINNTNEVGNFPRLIIGNKCDLESEREVETLEGENLARFNAIFCETSVMFGINVDAAVEALTTEIYNLRVLRGIKIQGRKKQCLIV